LPTCDEIKIYQPQTYENTFADRDMVKSICVFTPSVELHWPTEFFHIISSFKQEFDRLLLAICRNRNF